MKKSSKESKFKIGETVVAKVNKTIKLVINDYKDRIYYCIASNGPKNRVMVYFEREIERIDTMVFTLKKGERLVRLFGIIK